MPYTTANSTEVNAKTTNIIPSGHLSVPSAQGTGTICSAAVRSVDRMDGERGRRSASGTEAGSSETLHLSGLAHPGVPSYDSRGAWPPSAWGPTIGRCVVVALAARGAYGLDRRAACRSAPWRSTGIWPWVSPWSGRSIRDAESRRLRPGWQERTAHGSDMARLVPPRGGGPDNRRARPPRCPPEPCRCLPVAAESRDRGKLACRRWGCSPLKEGHNGSQTDKRTRGGASALRVSPRFEGHRRLRMSYTRRDDGAQCEG